MLQMAYLFAGVMYNVGSLLAASGRYSRTV